MFGTVLQLGRVGADDRFYIAVKGRKNRRHKQNQQQEPQRGEWEQVKGNLSAEKRNQTEKHSMINPARQFCSNLSKFLESTRPSVAAQHFSKTTMRGRRTCDIVYQPYFTMGDLWESFVEWSAYGAGVPLILDGNDSAVQYYVPYLSGIQLYGESAEKTKSRENDHYRESNSDDTDDYASNGSISDETSTSHESLSSGGHKSGKCSPGQLLFEFLEHETPHSREPLANKIFDLARQYPGLKTLRSCDLLPVSWIAIAWYPIYRIPTGPRLKDLDACFLTYHSLSTPSRDGGTNQTEVDGIARISLPAFGLASYKLKGPLWTHNLVSENQMMSSLSQAAANWLKLLEVNHPDFQFFTSHGMHKR